MSICTYLCVYLDVELVEEILSLSLSLYIYIYIYILYIYMSICTYLCVYLDVELVEEVLARLVVGEVHLGRDRALLEGVEVEHELARAGGGHVDVVVA